MHWIDVSLPPAGVCPETDRRLDEARSLQDTIGPLQDQHGLDDPAVTRVVEDVGRLLFAAVTAADPEAFAPDPCRPGADCPEQPDRLGFHLIADEDESRAGLPWTWLHNGVTHLLEKYPIVVASHASRLPELDPPRLWMQRQSDALFEATDPAPTPRALPEVLFVPGHGRDEIRRLMFREAEGIDGALDARHPSRGRLRIPGAVTPGLLAARAMLYQALHFAAPTSQPPEVSGAGEQRWLASLMAAAGHPDADTVDDLVGQDLEILGVDPVEAALDQALEAYARRGAPAAVGIGGATAPGSGWMLDDGPVSPEHLGRDGCLPPLIFSNSWCSLAWLGQRFLTAGASTFVGTALPVFSRPARLFAALFYRFLGDGRCAGLAAQDAALALRDRLGREHPAWLAYGVQGYGTLRLNDL
jgi:hypothetical protein